MTSWSITTTQSTPGGSELYEGGTRNGCKYISLEWWCSPCNHRLVQQYPIRASTSDTLTGTGYHANISTIRHVLGTQFMKAIRSLILGSIIALCAMQEA
jgi:Tryptophan/tyrosine permease family